MSRYKGLLARLKAWRRWDTFHRGTFWGLRGTLVGMLASLIFSFFAITTESLQAASYLRLLALGGVGGFGISLLLLWLKRPNLIQSARRYEQHHKLKERISTAIELHADENISPEWKALQLNDAYQASTEIDPRSGFDWRINKRDWAGLLVVAVLAVGTWFYGQGAFEQAFIKAEQQAQIEAQVNEIENLITEIQTNETLSEAEREQVTTPLQAAVEELNQAESMEEAVSILADAQQSLDELSQAGEAASEGLQEASEKLAELQAEQKTPFGEAMSNASFQEAAEALNEMSGNMDAQTQSALSEELSQAAQAMQETNPEMAEKMQQAADALQQEMDAEQLQQTLEEIAEAMEQANEQMELSQAAEQSSEALESGRESLMQAGNESQPQSEGQEMAGEQEGEQPGSGFSESGEGAQDSTNAPERIEAEGESEGLDPSGESSAALGQIASQFEQSGESIESYESFYTQYENSAWESLQSDAVPLALRSVVRDYFSSLNP
jgi:myosin heavy subunit